METTANFDDIKAILREIAEQQKERQRELAEQQQKTQHEIAAMRQQSEHEIAAMRQQSEREIAEIRQETERIKQETEKIQQETEKEISRVAKIVGDIGNKFGSFTEGMAFPSMDKVLRKQFGMKIVTTNYVVDAGSDSLEIDVLGLANGEVNTVVIIEVKSHLKRRDIEQTLKTIERFRRLHPEHANKKLYGIIACVSGAKEQREEAQKAGLYVASIHDEVFELKTPAYFIPKDFSAEVVK